MCAWKQINFLMNIGLAKRSLEMWKWKKICLRDQNNIKNVKALCTVECQQEKSVYFVDFILFRFIFNSAQTSEHDKLPSDGIMNIFFYCKRY